MAKGDKHVGATDIVGNKEAKKESPALGKKLVDLSEKKGTITLVTPPSWFTNQDDKNMDDLVVHLRLGDNGPNIHTPFEWYKKAIEDNEIEFHKLFLITDGSDSEDARKFKSYYDAEIPSSVNVETNQDWKKYLHETMFDFNFIRKFDKILFSNSTFSWWASLLSDASHIWFNKEWQPNHYHGKIRLGETNYSKWNPIIPFSLKEK